MRAIPQVRQGLVRGGGQPLQVVLGGPEYAQLVEWRDLLLARFEANPQLSGVDSDYKETRPQLRIAIDKDRAADLGVAAADIGNVLQTMLGSSRATTFVNQGKEYDVLVQAERKDRGSIDQLKNLYVRTRDNTLVPLSSVVTVTEIAEPGTLNRFNRLRSITVSARLAPGYPLGEAIDFARQAARRLPETAQIDLAASARVPHRWRGDVHLRMALLVRHGVEASRKCAQLCDLLTVRWGIGARGPRGDGNHKLSAIASSCGGLAARTAS